MLANKRLVVFRLQFCFIFMIFGVWGLFEESQKLAEELS